MKKLIPILLNLFQIIEDEIHFPINFMRSVSPDTKIRQRQYKKKKKKNPWANILCECDAINLNKILPQEIQQYIKISIHHEQVGFFPEM